MPYNEVVIYTRASKDRTGAGVKVENQEQDGRTLAAELGKTVREVYVDNDISAAQRKKPRKEYLRMLADLERSPADVIAWHADRLHRQPAELERYIDIIEPRQIMTYMVKASPFDLTTPSGRLVARMLGNAASYEVEHMQERQRAAKKHAAAKGIPLGGRRSFGYTAGGMELCHGPVTMTAQEAARRGLDPAGTVATRWGERVTVVLPYDEAAELDSEARRVLEGTSLHAISRQWNERGVRTSTGSTWTATEVRRVMLNPRNAGLMKHRGEIVGQAAWPAAIDELTWRRLRAMFADPGRRSTQGPQRRWLGSGIYVCGTCGRTMMATTTSSPTQPRRPVYRCLSTRHFPRSDLRHHPARDAGALDAFVEQYIKVWLSIPANIAKLRQPLADLAGVEKELAVIGAELDEHAENAGARRITARQMAILSEPLMARQKALELQIETARHPEVLGGMKLTGDALWDALRDDLDRRRALLGMVLNVRVLPQPNGRPAGWKPGQPYFHPECVEITRKM